jgi:hypothetical protein
MANSRGIRRMNIPHADHLTRCRFARLVIVRERLFDAMEISMLEIAKRVDQFFKEKSPVHERCGDWPVR